jgi:hypothetical protein
MPVPAPFCTAKVTGPLGFAEEKAVAEELPYPALQVRLFCRPHVSPFLNRVDYGAGRLPWHTVGLRHNLARYWTLSLSGSMLNWRGLLHGK